MPKTIQMPDGKIVEFPDNMSDAQISQAIRVSERPGVPAPPQLGMQKLGMLSPGGGWSPDELLRGAGAGIKNLFAHLPEAVASMASPGLSAGMAPTGEGYPAFSSLGSKAADKSNAQMQTRGQQDMRDSAKFIGANPAYAIGGVAGPAALTAGTAKLVSLAPELGSALRTAAIGDTDAAALRGLRVPAGSPKALRTISSVENSRPFLKGAKSLSDLQSKVTGAKAEIWKPYQETIDAIGDRKVQGPDGETTIRALEDERKQLSALNRELKSRTPNPEAVQLAEQKGLNQAQLLEREKAVQGALDPVLQDAGINPKLIRQTFGSVAEVGSKISGKSTLAEKPQPYGFGKIANLSIKQPLQAPGNILGGLRDIVAGRPLYQGSPTDVSLREAFRTGGEKPDFGSFKAPQERLQLPASTIGNAPYGEDIPMGSMNGIDERNPVRVPPAPLKPLALPATASAGETQPMVRYAKPYVEPFDPHYAPVNIQEYMKQLKDMVPSK